MLTITSDRCCGFTEGINVITRGLLVGKEVLNDDLLGELVKS